MWFWNRTCMFYSYLYPIFVRQWRSISNMPPDEILDASCFVFHILLSIFCSLNVYCPQLINFVVQRIVQQKLMTNFHVNSALKWSKGIMEATETEDRFPYKEWKRRQENEMKRKGRETANMYTSESNSGSEILSSSSTSTPSSFN